MKISLMMLRIGLILQIKSKQAFTNRKENLIGLMKDELGGKIIMESVTLRPKTYSFLTDDRKEDKKAKVRA